ncbi:RNA polymerase sigma factor [Thermospira aquatica]|uniref:RNA polymerase sigma factor n=1 Tax=Thermospira aquatica TaxID=2828656 RepID=A0AAX3BFA7_9SPIR|nr:RNA polymerase sigma factor [Thermospira aquatica]URA11024.1 RNA polymerase sigma factor [Thermospira aquatica]
MRKLNKDKKSRVETLSDESLMEGLQQTAKDGETFAPEALPYLEALYTRYYSQVVRLVRYYGLSGDEADDIAQEVFIRLYYRCKSYDSSRPFKAWFFRLVYNLTINYLKKNSRESFLSFDDARKETEMIDEKTENSFEKFQFWHTFQGILYEMPEKLRTVLLWHGAEGMSFDEIAKILNITSRQVRNRYDQALEWVRERLGRDTDEEI